MAPVPGFGLAISIRPHEYPWIFRAVLPGGDGFSTVACGGLQAVFAPFQYFGWWGLACFLLQGLFGALLCLRVTRSSVQAFLSSLLFIVSPVLWQGTFSSAGVAGHWVLLAALLPLIYRRQFAARTRFPFFVWILLGAFSIGIHWRLTLICAIFCIGYCLYAALESRQWSKFLSCLDFGLGVFISGYLLGVFSGGVTFDLRLFGVPYNALWDARNYSSLLRNVSSAGDQAYAGFAFLGFGVLLLGVLALVWLIKPLFSRKRKIQPLVHAVQTHRADIAALGFVGVACVVLGLAQPVAYLATVAAVAVLARKMSRRLVSAVLACCLCWQMFDTSTVFQARRIHYSQESRNTSAAEISEWASFLQNDAWSAVALSPAVCESVCLAPLAESVVQSGRSLGALSYASASTLQEWEDALLNPRGDTVFVFTAEEMLDETYLGEVLSHLHYLYQWDGLIVGFAMPTLLPYQPILGMEDISLSYYYPIGESIHLREGEDIGGVRYIYAGGLSYGPYLTLEAGQYQLRVTGQELDEAKFSFTYAEGAIETQETLSSPTAREYQIDVSEAVSRLEVLIQNDTSHMLSFDAMTVTQRDGE